MDGRVIGEIIYKKTANGVKWDHGVRYIYGDDGSVIGFGIWDADTVNEWERYYFIKNVQGDVLHVYREADNKLVASYEYDPFGKVSVTYSDGDMANENPFRYRGYYYDNETGFYYLQSRYYDPTTCRFINADEYASTGQGFSGFNMFAYCGNNPVMNIDPTGELFFSTLVICIAAGAILGGTVGGIAGNAYANSKGYTGWDKAKSILIGVGAGGLIGGTLGGFAAPAVASATGIAGVTVTSAGISTVAAVGASFGKLGTLIANNGQQIINWEMTTLHGLQRMAERGVTRSMVETWVTVGKALQQAGEKILYVTKQGAVVINKARQVVKPSATLY